MQGSNKGPGHLKCTATSFKFQRNLSIHIHFPLESRKHHNKSNLEFTLFKAFGLIFSNGQVGPFCTCVAAFSSWHCRRFLRGCVENLNPSISVVKCILNALCAHRLFWMFDASLTFTADCYFPLSCRWTETVLVFTGRTWPGLIVGFSLMMHYNLDGSWFMDL